MPQSVPHTARGHISNAPGRQATNFGTLAPNMLTIIVAILFFAIPKCVSIRTHRTEPDK